MEVWSEVAKGKRKANSPMEGREKERRSDMMDQSEIETLNLNFREATDSLGGARRESVDSFSSVTSARAKVGEKPKRQSVFKTSKPEGAFRDEIVVELNTLDDQVYRGTINIRDAINEIYVKKLGFQKKDLSSFSIGYSGGQIVTYKLKNQINIDELKCVEHFEIEKTVKIGNEERLSVLKCRVRGIRNERDPTNEAYTDPGMRWVKLEGCEFRIDGEEMARWMGYFGEVKSEATEDTVPDPDSEDDIEYGTGIYSIKMKIDRDLPQFMPMFGKRVRIYYRGIVKKCTNCFEAHQRKFCKNEKVQWIDYVRGFRDHHPEIPLELYGRWAKMIETTTQSSQPTNQDRTNSGEATAEIGGETEEERVETRSSAKAPMESKKIVKKNLKPQTQKKTNAALDDPQEVGKDDGGEETDEEDLLNLVKLLKASGVSSKSIKETIKKQTSGAKGVQGTRAGGRGKGRAKP